MKYSGYLLVCAALSLSCGYASQEADMEQAQLNEVQAALQAGRGLQWERQLRELTASADRAHASQAQSLLAHLALQRSRVAADLAQGLAGKRQHWIDAVRHARAAEMGWRQVHEQTGSDDVARRNVWRAQQWTRELLALAEQAGESVEDEGGSTQNEQQTEIDDSQGASAGALKPQLPDAQVLELEQRLESQRELQLQRRAAQPTVDRVEVERDW